jgi:hypothetical protein
MKRSRKDWQSEEEDEETESKRRRVSQAIAAINRAVLSRGQGGGAGDTNDFFSTQSLRTPTYLRSPGEEVEEKTKEEEEDEIQRSIIQHFQAVENAERKREGKVPSVPIEQMFAIKRLLQKPYLPIVDPQSERLISSSEEERTNLTGNLPPNFPIDLFSVIHNYSAPEEIGTPREKCYLETETFPPEEEDQRGRSSERGNDGCKKTIDVAVAKLEKLKYKREELKYNSQEPLSFEDAECTLYCLLTHLPRYVRTGGSSGTITVPFRVRFEIDDYTKTGDSFVIEIDYDITNGNYNISLEYDYGFQYLGEDEVFREYRSDLLMKDVIEVLLYYGSFSRILLATQEHIYAFYNESLTNNIYWNSLVKILNKRDGTILFQGKNIVNDEED